MTKMTDEHDNLTDTEDVCLSVPQSEIDKIFILADKIYQVQVRYDDDPLVMANEAIKIMKEAAAEIAASTSTLGL